MGTVSEAILTKLSLATFQDTLYEVAQNVPEQHEEPIMSGGREAGAALSQVSLGLSFPVSRIV